jgi:hypothetical protein
MASMAADERSLSHQADSLKLGYHINAHEGFARRDDSAGPDP